MADEAGRRMGSPRFRARPEVWVGDSLRAGMASPGGVEEKFVRHRQVVLSYGQGLGLGQPSEGWFVEQEARARWIAPWVVGRSGVDVGSGGGYPGVSVALLRPDVLWTFCERRARRAAFLELLLGELGVSGEVFSGDVRTLQCRSYDCALGQAVPPGVVGEMGRIANGQVIWLTSQGVAENMALPAGFQWSVLPESGSRGRVAVRGRRDK